MPRPPILPLVDWPTIFNNGLEWESWLAKAEFHDKRDAMAESARTLIVPPDAEALLDSVTRPVHVVAIAEDWCGDVVRHAPVMQVITRKQPLVRLRFIARADHPHVFVRFLTNGGEAIPKFIFLNEYFTECGNWGPMQEDCRLWIARGKAAGDIHTARKKVSAIYEADQPRAQAFRELAALVALAATRTLD
jgi:hypothetical protein